MLGRKKRRKTGTQVVGEVADDIATKVTRIYSLKAICTACIVIFSFSICFGLYGLASRMKDISKREQSINKLKNELIELENEIEKKQELKTKLIDDPLAIEALARSYGMSRKGERVFYFLD